MQRADMDRLADEHFRYEANDDVDGVLATLTDDASHHLVGSPYGEASDPATIRAFYAELFGSLAGERVEPVGRWYGEDFLVDVTLWTGHVSDGRLLGQPGRAGHATFRMLHLFEFRDGRIAREQVWTDSVAIANALT
jgi:ketosteroid isomerase-like protein